MNIDPKQKSNLIVILRIRFMTFVLNCHRRFFDHSFFKIQEKKQMSHHPKQ